MFWILNFWRLRWLFHCSWRKVTLPHMFYYHPATYNISKADNSDHFKPAPPYIGTYLQLVIWQLAFFTRVCYLNSKMILKLFFKKMEICKRIIKSGLEMGLKVEIIWEGRRENEHQNFLFSHPQASDSWIGWHTPVT